MITFKQYSKKLQIKLLSTLTSLLILSQGIAGLADQPKAETLTQPQMGASVVKDPTATFHFLKGQQVIAPFDGYGIFEARVKKLDVMGQDLQTCQKSVKDLTMNIASANKEPAWYEATPVKIGAGIILGLILGKLLEVKY